MAYEQELQHNQKTNPVPALLNYICGYFLGGGVKVVYKNL